MKYGYDPKSSTLMQGMKKVNIAEHLIDWKVM